MLKRAAVIKSADAARIEVHAPARVPQRRARIVRRAVVEAKQQAEEVLEQARAQAAALRAEAAKDAATLRHEATDEGRALGHAQVLAQAAMLGRMEAEAEKRSLGRTIELARLLAERLLGTSLQLDATTVVALAEQALNELKAVRQVRLVAHPDDVAVLTAKLVTATPGFGVSADPSLARGDFRLLTDVGTIEASVGQRLELLATKLSDSLKKGG